jgi:hypothetical protein
MVPATIATLIPEAWLSLDSVYVADGIDVEVAVDSAVAAGLAARLARASMSSVIGSVNQPGRWSKITKLWTSVGIASNQGGAVPEVNCSYIAVAKTLSPPPVRINTTAGTLFSRTLM